jgi:hypothetical protein
MPPQPLSILIAKDTEIPEIEAVLEWVQKPDVHRKSTQRRYKDKILI